MAPPSPARATVLVVDDNPATAASLAAFLQADGFDARPAATATDALTALVGWRPDAAVIVVDDPGGDGMAVAAALAAEHRQPLLIALLGPSATATVPRHQLAVFDYAFAKTASPAAVAERIARYMAQRTTRREGGSTGGG